MKASGLLNFEFIVLEECGSRYLDEKEYLWICELDTVNNGYNSTAGNIKKIKALKEDMTTIDYTVVPKVWQLVGKEMLGYDYDYIHGTDNPREVDSLICAINNGSIGE